MFKMEDELSSSEESFELDTGAINIEATAKLSKEDPVPTSKTEETEKSRYSAKPPLLIDSAIAKNLGLPVFNPKITQYTLLDIDIERMTEKPWLSSFADITDYFNYGFTEETWKEYLAVQVHLRNGMQNKHTTSIQTLSDKAPQRPLSREPPKEFAQRKPKKVRFEERRRFARR